MTNSDLKRLKDSVCDSLKIKPNKQIFTIEEKESKSKIKKLIFTFKNKDDVFIIRQDPNQHTTSVLKKYSTNSSCDFVVFSMGKNKRLTICFCEVKSSYCEKIYKKAYEQVSSSYLFVKYLLECYKFFYDDDTFLADISYKYYYVCPKIGISNKRQISKNKSKNDIYLSIKAVKEEYGVVTINDGYGFLTEN